MKRCPECDFIYENDQSFCDMDGRELVHDPRPVPIEQSVATEPTTPPVKSQWRSLAVPLLATVGLGAILFVVYYGLTHRTAPQHINRPSAKVITSAQSAPNLVPVLPTATAIPSPTLSSDAQRSNVKTANSGSPIAKPSQSHSQSAALKREEKKQKSELAKQKKESRIGSILKKTGRILKRPFKF